MFRLASVDHNVEDNPSWRLTLLYIQIKSLYSELLAQNLYPIFSFCSLKIRSGYQNHHHQDDNQDKSYYG